MRWPLAYLRLGEAQDRLGARAEAVEAYAAAQSAGAAPDDPHEVADRRPPSGCAARPTPRDAEAYRLSLEGWRLFEQNDLAGAAAALERSLVAERQRAGRALSPRPRAAGDEERIPPRWRSSRRRSASASSCPPPILGNAYLEARAAARARRASATQALSYYRIAATLFGAASETRAAATRSLTRLRSGDARTPR